MTKSPTKTRKPRATKVLPSYTLDDLNNNLTLIDEASDKDIVSLNNQANDNPDYPLAGPIRYLLNRRANLILATKEG